MVMGKRNLFYAQSGGASAAINATACGVIETARKFHNKIGHVYAGANGILGILNEELIDVNQESERAIAALKHTPGAAFGSCRYKLKSLSEESRAEYERLFEVFEAYNIGYFLYNGGNDSQDTTHKIAKMSEVLGRSISCVGIPKTIDNDLYATDSCPGFGSVAKYVAISIKEAGLDIASMARTSTKVFIMEVMGRNAGWIAAAAGLAAESAGDPPHIILLPEVPFIEEQFLNKVDHCVEKYGYCAIVVSEGTRDREGIFLSDSGFTDAFGHTQLGGVAPVLARLIKSKLKMKCHWAVSDYLQRAARHIASSVDIDQAYALGQAAVEFALAGKTDIMASVIRYEGTESYEWGIGETPLINVANRERLLPPEFIASDGLGITPSCRDYLLPLIQGEAYPPYKNGLPEFAKLEKNLAEKRIQGMAQFMNTTPSLFSPSGQRIEEK